MIHEKAILRDFYKLVVAQADIGSAEKGFKLIQDMKLTYESYLFQIIICGSIISYSRPFVGNKTYGKLASRYSKFNDSIYREIHNEILSMRNTVIAHSDSDKIKVIMIPKGSMMIINNKDKIEIKEMGFSVRYPGIHENRVADYIKVCEYLKKEYNEMIFELKEDKIINPDLLKCPYELEV